MKKNRQVALAGQERGKKGPKEEKLLAPYYHLFCVDNEKHVTNPYFVVRPSWPTWGFGIFEFLVSKLMFRGSGHCIRAIVLKKFIQLF